MNKRIIVDSRRIRNGWRTLTLKSVSLGFVWMLVFVLPCFSASNTLKTGDIVVVQQSSGSIYKVDPITGASTLGMSNANLTGFSHAILDSQNRVLTATRSTYGILRFDFSTGIAQSVASGPFLQRATSIAFDQVGNLIVGGSDEWLTRINLTTGAQEHLTHFSFSSGIQDVDVGADGLMYVLDFGNYPSGGGRVFTYDSATGIQHLLAQGGDIYQAGDMMIAPDGNLLVLSSTNHASKIVKVDAKTGQQQLLKTLGDEGFISLDRDGSLLFAGFYGMDVERINLTSGVISHVGNIGGIGNLTGIAVVVPEPNATVLAILGGIAFLAGRRSRRN